MYVSCLRMGTNHPSSTSKIVEKNRTQLNIYDIDLDKEITKE